MRRQNDKKEKYLMMQKYKGIDLFCGIGGFRLVMKSNNVKCVFSSDNDKFQIQRYYKKVEYRRMK